ncbi:hypothetical protein IQ235_04240 [Oscillatoriales cyanobacterium LEGE 11467]|uniref:Uncharacterized protein n=1 Tax=Zarconia navalis LEGE 11467 TaxID=1828826 RepID=A0A928Z8M8_9CYAN|nr:hypothetical protein [Zarconia navalis]MBE9040001.1 hypothetical protein [Zarconia navalis LEGE 11467]
MTCTSGRTGNSNETTLSTGAFFGVAAIVGYRSRDGRSRGKIPLSF